MRKVKLILVRVETTPDDIHGIVASQGVLTSGWDDQPRCCGGAGDGQTMRLRLRSHKY